jgi:hypothetical protein
VVSAGQLPDRALTALGRGRDRQPLVYSPDRGRADPDAEAQQVALDPLVPPARYRSLILTSRPGAPIRSGLRPDGLHGADHQVSKGTDSGIEDEVTPATTKEVMPRPQSTRDRVVNPAGHSRPRYQAASGRGLRQR